MKVIIELDDDYDFEIKATEHEIRYILMDALAEFQSHRGPTPEAYVNRRYPDSQVYAGKKQREEKIQQVAHRIRLAERLHRGVFRLEE